MTVDESRGTNKVLGGSLKLSHNQQNYDKRSLFIFPIDSWIRKVLIKIVDSRSFEYLIILVIVMNSITLAMYNYEDRDSNGRFNQIIDQTNLVFTCIFIGEGLLKVLAKGLIFHSDSYLRNGWNIIDTIVIISG